MTSIPTKGAPAQVNILSLDSEGIIMHPSNQEALIVIEGRATYERILSTLCDAEPEEVIRQIQNFLKVYPEFAQAHNDLAVILHRIGNTLMALAHHEKAHKLAPFNITFRKNLADFYAVELDWADEAIHIYLDILKDNPFDVESLTALGTISERSGRREQANQYFARAHQLDPLAKSAREALQLIGDETSPVRQLSPAQEAPSSPLTHPLYQPPVSPEHLHAQAIQAAIEGQGQVAIELLEELVRQYPDYAAAYNDLGVLYQQAGNLHMARQYHEEAIAVAPANATFLKNLAELLAVGCKCYEDALKVYLKLLAADPRDVETLQGLAYICIETGKLNDAKPFLENILAIQPWNNDARETLESLSAPPPSPQYRSAADLHADASRHAAENRLEEAKLLLQELVQLYPDNALGHNDLGVIRYRLGDVEGSQRDYERAVELEPLNTNFKKNLADLYFTEIGKTDEAIGIYLSLFRDHPQDVETLSALGQICTAVGKPDEANSFFKRLLEIEPWNLAAREALHGTA